MTSIGGPFGRSFKPKLADLGMLKGAEVSVVTYCGLILAFVFMDSQVIAKTVRCEIHLV